MTGLVGSISPGGLTGSITGFLHDGMAYSLGFSSFNRPSVGHAKGARLTYGDAKEVNALRGELRKSGIPKEPQGVVATGTLFPCLLLCAGWWERKSRSQKNSFSWNNSIQEWLYRGFEEWAPSLDVSFRLPEETKPYLYAQLGSGDEADSILVIVPWQKAKRIRELMEKQLLDGRGLAVEVKITGAMCHRSQLPIPEAEKKKLGSWGKAFDYCICLDPEEIRHSIEVILEPKPYSGYLWQCLVPEKVLAKKANPLLDDVYFVWEHTDFTQPDTVKYNLDSLLHKVRYIESYLGDGLILLQKSSAMVPGDCVYKTQQFYDYIAEGSAIAQE